MLLCLLCGIALQAQTKLENVDPATFKRYVDEKKGMLIDLRTPDETKKGLIPGATQLDYLAKDAEVQIAKLDKTKTYLIYCAGGGRSEECANLMKSLGFLHVVNLQKGFDAWKKAGYPITK